MIAAEEATGLTHGAAGAPSLAPPRVNTIKLDDWAVAVSLDEHEEMVRSTQRAMMDRVPSGRFLK